MASDLPLECLYFWRKAVCNFFSPLWNHLHANCDQILRKFRALVRQLLIEQSKFLDKSQIIQYLVLIKRYYFISTTETVRHQFHGEKWLTKFLCGRIRSDERSWSRIVLGIPEISKVIHDLVMVKWWLKVYQIEKVTCVWERYPKVGCRVCSQLTGNAIV